MFNACYVHAEALELCTLRGSQTDSMFNGSKHLNIEKESNGSKLISKGKSNPPSTPRL